MNKAKGIFMALCIAVMSVLPVQAQEELRIKYVQSMLPQLSLCINFGDIQPNQDDLTLSLGKEKLQVESLEKFSFNKHREKIYILLDLSTSMRRQYFDAIISSVENLIKDSGDNRDITLVTFGNGTPAFYQEMEALTLLPNLQPNEEGTKINEVIEQTLSQARDLPFDQYNLAYGIIISDGVEYSKGSTTTTEIQQSFQRLPMAFYGLCTDYSSADAMNSFRSLMAETNGGFDQFGLNDLDEKLSQMLLEAEDVYIAEATASTNRGSETNLNVKYQNASENLMVSLKSSVDIVSPEIADWQYDKETKKLCLTVSENLSQESVANGSVILLRNGEQEFSPDSLVYRNTSQLELIFDQPLPNGSYEISFSHITDTSDNQNPLQACAIEITNSHSPFILWLARYWFVPVIAICIVMLFILLIVALKKKNRVRVVRDVFSTDGEEKINLSSNNGKKFHFYIENPQGNVQDFEIPIAQSRLFGRSHNLCDVTFNDPKMSRQHFSIGVEDETVYIQDLGSKNGTFLNGSRITDTEVLHSGDKIIAGQNTITVEF